MSNSDVESLVEGLVASGALIMVIAIIGIMLLLSIAVYVLQAVPLYKMAKKLGHQYPWMAWIPFANTYLMFTLPDKQLRILAFNKDMDLACTEPWRHRNSGYSFCNSRYRNTYCNPVTVCNPSSQYFYYLCYVQGSV